MQIVLLVETTAANIILHELPRLDLNEGPILS